MAKIHTNCTTLHFGAPPPTGVDLSGVVLHHQRATAAAA